MEMPRATATEITRDPTIRTRPDRIRAGRGVTWRNCSPALISILGKVSGDAVVPFQKH